ncbi:MAG: TetR/AcrR family transcriptional regulator [Acidobacteria bacterium]|jgi:AcrR family transcriptional regulator|nr:TetR/AcrR family transcriptional regulator [Acidobacteriota bacterium]
MARPRFANLDVDTRYRILETAAMEFASRGYQGVSLNQLLDRLGMSKGSFYYYFDDKADLFSTVADLAWAIFLPIEEFDLEEFNAENFWPSLEALMREMRSRIRANPWLVGFTRLMYNPPDIPGVLDALSEKFAEARQWQAELIERGQAVGTVRDDLPAGLLQALLVGADEAGDRWVVENWERLGEVEVERIFDQVFGIFRRMLESPP